jgi:hypothetical protein
MALVLALPWGSPLALHWAASDEWAFCWAIHWVLADRVAAASDEAKGKADWTAASSAVLERTVKAGWETHWVTDWATDFPEMANWRMGVVEFPSAVCASEKRTAALCGVFPMKDTLPFP